MITKNSGIHILSAVIVTGVLVAAAIVSNCQGDNNVEEPNQPTKKQASKNREPPVIIWFHNYCDSPQALETALSSGLVTHVMIKCKHRTNSEMSEVRGAIDIAKDSNAELIWCRNLWPYSNVEGVTKDTIFDPNYYINEIQILRTEANKISADFTALDTEAYSNSPVKPYLGINKLDSQEQKQLHFAINKAVGTVGKVDFLRPGGGNRKGHTAELLAGLGKYRLSGIGHSVDALEHEPPYEIYDYEIFAAYLFTVKESQDTTYTYFLIPEIFENSQIWSAKKGLFLYPREHKALEVAKELLAYSKSLPVKKSQD